MPENIQGQLSFFQRERGILTDFQVSEPASTFGSINPPIQVAVPPGFTPITSVSITINSQTDRIWLNGTLSLTADFAAVGVVTVTLQLLRETTIIYQTTKTISSPQTVPATVSETVHLEHIDVTAVTGDIPVTTTYTLRAQTDMAIVSASGPITLTAAQLERNPA
ncbi:MAG: hypothetical protein GX892_13715 [Thermoanaerobacteraceae bacterium]|nr:hypothetical protein [Thermoanaerobacteraceae bacterium]